MNDLSRDGGEKTDNDIQKGRWWWCHTRIKQHSWLRLLIDGWLHFLCRAASIITGLTAATPCTRTGTPSTTTKTLWCESACTWTSAGDGAGRTARRRCQGPFVTALHQVSHLWLVPVDMHRFTVCVTLSCASVQAANPSGRRRCVPPPRSSSSKVVTILSQWCTKARSKRRGSTAGW